MSVPSLESLLAQHLPMHGEYRAGNVGCTCGWEAFVKVDPIADDLDIAKTEVFAAHVAEVIRQHHTSDGRLDRVAEFAWRESCNRAALEDGRKPTTAKWAEVITQEEWRAVVRDVLNFTLAPADGAEDQQ